MIDGFDHVLVLRLSSSKRGGIFHIGLNKKG